MYHTSAYVAMLIRAAPVPLKQRSYMLRALLMMAREYSAVCEGMENDSFPGFWDPWDAIARIVAQTTPADPALRSSVTEILRVHEGQLGTCVQADRMSGCNDPLGPATTSGRSRLPHMEGFLIVGKKCFDGLSQQDRAAFLSALQEVPLQKFPQLPISIVAIERDEREMRMMIHHSTRTRQEDAHVTAVVEQACAALLVRWKQ